MSVSYVVNGKIYTSYPLMDDIVFNCKLILNGIVVKNEYVAHLYETEETLQAQELLFKCKANSFTFETFPYTLHILIEFGYDRATAAEYLNDITLIPEEDRDALLAFSVQYTIDTYEEKNKYYRNLTGYPEYGTDKYNIYITEDDLPIDFDTESVDYTIPIHLQPSIVISALRSNGRLNEIIEENRSFNYSYLRFLSDLALDPYTCRKAGKWDILYMPDANNMIVSRFQEIYDINKYRYLRRTYQTAYAFKSDYYDHMLIFILLSQTFADMISDTPEWYIRKDIFDIKTVEFFLDSYGIPFFQEIPLKYQIRIVKNINKLLKYKSTEQNFDDILDIFKLRETHIYQYYLYKKRKTDGEGHYIDDPDLNKMYELLFVETLLGDTYDNYIKNLNNRAPYDEITLGDEYWDGTDDHDYVKHEILKKEFTIEPTKYLTLKADINYLDYQRQLIYLMGLIVDTRVNISDLTLAINGIYEGVPFKLSDVFIFIVLCNNLQFDIFQDIIKPEDVKEDKTIVIPDYDLDKDNWWVKEIYPEFFINYDNRVFGFNPNVNLAEVEAVLARSYTNFSEKFYTLADFGCDTFIVPTGTIDTYEKLLDMYETNMKCYERLNYIMCHQCRDELQQLMARYIYNQLFTKEYDYNLSKTYGDSLVTILKNRDYILWDFYNELSKITDKETRKTDIVSILNEITVALEYYMDRDSLDYFFSFIGTSDFSAISRYIYLMINVFKSYKAHFISPTIRYKFLYPDAFAGNYVEMNDTIFNRSVSFSKFDKEYMHDLLYIYTGKAIEDYTRINYVEILDIFNGFDPDPDDDYDYDGGEPDTSDYSKDLDGTEVDMLVPYRTSDGGTPYGNDTLTKYQINGRDEYILNLETRTALELDGGDISTEEDTGFIHSDDFYFFKKYDRNYDGGTPDTEYIVNNRFFKRLYDYQDHQEMRVSARTGLKYTENAETGEASLKEIWREWLSITEFEAVKGDQELMLQLMDNNEFAAYYSQFLDDLDHERVKVFMDELEQKKNKSGIDLTLTNIKAEDNKNVPWDWDYGDIDDPDSGNELLDISNYENEVLSEYNFEDLDDPEPENVHHIYNFGDVDLSRILWIEDIYNYDTSRIITYKF